MNYQSSVDEIIQGLRQTPKRIPSKYFYDKKGSELFDEICELNEYYLTRTEYSILQQNIKSIASCFEDDSLLVEFGSGSSTKTRLLLENIDNLGGYVPIDISTKHLNEAVKKLNSEFPDLEIHPLAADYTLPLKLPLVHNEAEQRIIFFPGSTLGNFTNQQARKFFKTIHDEIHEGDGFLLGADLIKEKNILVAAYNDSLNITADFNLNILSNINRKFNADFNLSEYKHKAVFNESESRIEMYLISGSDQKISIGDLCIEIKQGEKILTEYSHKYTIGMIDKLAENYFSIKKVWTDLNKYFAVIFMEPIFN